MDSHNLAVKRIVETVKDFHSRNEPYRIFHGSTNSTRPGQNDRVVDISSLSNILNIDTKSKIATVEPNVPMDKLVEATLAHGLVPPVVMEFPGITVGGGNAGTAGESSSFKYGYFSEIIHAVEMVLANVIRRRCCHTAFTVLTIRERPSRIHGADRRMAVCIR